MFDVVVIIGIPSSWAIICGESSILIRLAGPCSIFLIS